MTKSRTNPLNPGEAKLLSSRVYDLSDVSAKAALYGVVHNLTLRVNVNADLFSEILEDALKYDFTLKRS
jgi:hypothetical protein